MEDQLYLIINDNEVLATFSSHMAAQEHAQTVSRTKGVTKVVYLPTLRVNGIWEQGTRIY